MFYLAQLGTTVNVKADASCGYYLFVLDLKDIGKKDICEKVTKLGFKLYKHSENSFHKFRQNIICGAILK